MLPTHAFAAFKGFSGALEVHMVEVSPALREIQRRSLACHQDGPDPVGKAVPRGSTSLRSKLAGCQVGGKRMESDPVAGGGGALALRSTCLRDRLRLNVAHFLQLCPQELPPLCWQWL